MKTLPNQTAFESAPDKANYTTSMMPEQIVLAALLVLDMMLAVVLAYLRSGGAL